jgi:glycosyltransferase involved in cell wall biosynthesis
MIPGRVSILIPSRNEQFLVPTVTDLLAKAAGDIELVVVLDGYWPDPPLPDDSRIVVLHRGRAEGMRPAINAAATVASGEFLMKCDAHCMFDEGFDVKLRADYQDDNWILIPRRYALDPIAWAIDTSNKKYPVDYHFLSEPFERHGDAVPGLHGSAWTARREARKHILIDDELASQGSCYFIAKSFFNQLGPLDIAKFGSFWAENQELSLKAWMMGGAQKITKNTWYSHVFKGKRFGRGYSTAGMGHENGTAFCAWFFMTDQPFKGKVRTMRSIIEQFAPVPTWADIDAIFDRAQRELRNPYALAA